MCAPSCDSATSHPAPPAFFPDDGDVHLWRILVDGVRLDATVLAETLDPVEVVRMRGFYDSATGLRWSMFRVALRTILGEYLGLPARNVPLALGARGKPVLVESGDAELSFNLAHADGYGLLAVARSPLGIDLETFVAVRHEPRLAARVMNAEEQAAYAALSPADRPAAFLRLWTRKEAYLKATGVGLALEPRTVMVNFGEPARLLQVAGQPREEDRWFLRHLAPWPGTVGALATGLAEPRLFWIDWAGLPSTGHRVVRSLGS